MVAPEHRQSLHLKWHELNQEVENEEICDDLHKIANMEYIDMLDESDDILRHKRVLVYACGQHCILPAGHIRWGAAEAIFKAIKLSSTVTEVLNRSNVSLIDTFGCDWSGKFPKIRLVPGRALDESTPDLLNAIARAVLDEPTHELRWLKSVSLKKKEAIIAFITIPNFLDETVLVQNEGHLDDLLALRGFLAFGLLVNCLSKRHRVDFGIKRIVNVEGKNRLMAVPFSANDTPSERSEYAQPDAAIILTTLSYYWDGLSVTELDKALKVLLLRPLPEQEKIYSEWLQHSEKSMSNEIIEVPLSIKNVRNLDIENAKISGSLYKSFRSNFATISFWLKFCVFPVETMQYTLKLTASSWDLTNNTKILCRGFSGTDDNKLLLPLQVHQNLVEDDELLAANGKMIDLILQQAYVTLNVHETNTSHLKIIEYALTTGCSGIIDAGAALVGISNSEVADTFLNALQAESVTGRIKGVLYFSIVRNEWRVKGVNGSNKPKSQSPISVSECFVIFDEGRCRGADVQMCSDAKCVLTLGPHMCKDKLMQAAGRARLLGKGQTLILLGTNEISTKISKFCGLDDPSQKISSRHVLEWVMANTVSATEEGINFQYFYIRRILITTIILFAFFITCLSKTRCSSLAYFHMKNSFVTPLVLIYLNIIKAC